MSLASLRRRCAPVAVITYASLLGAMAPRTVHAEEPPPVLDKGAAALDPGANASELPKKALEVDAQTAERLDAVATSSKTPGTDQKPEGLPTGQDKTGISGQSISVPQGAGKISGMGESFSAQLSTGIATYSVSFDLPSARGGAQPALALSYSSGRGHGVAGVGWDLGWAYIARQTDRGVPRYLDPGADDWLPEQDRFVFAGGQELVPICRVAAGACAGAQSGEVMPAWSSGWRYFRARVEGAFLRFFWSADGKTWRVQQKSGTTVELGVPLDGSGYSGALEVDPTDGNRTFRWNVVREFDAESSSALPAPQSAPVNVVAYRYIQDGALAYLSDIYDTPPADAPTTLALSSWAHHTRVRWEPRPDATTSWRRGWKTTSALRLRGVDVASKDYVAGPSDPRSAVRRYRVAYDGAYHPSLLANVEVEGRCVSDGVIVPTTEDAAEGLPDATSCPTLPKLTFGYQHVSPFHTDGTTGVADLPGFEGFDERVRQISQSPKYSLDDDLADLFDVNADGLPDVLVTAPAFFAGKHGVFVNGAGGTADTFLLRSMGIVPVLGADLEVLTWKNANVSPQDADGDGVVDLVHMPKVKTYSVYAPDTSAAEWVWRGRAITVASQQSPKIDFGKNSFRSRVVDVNGDGLVDVLVSTGTQYQTFFSLGRYPGGDGQFGQAIWTSATDAALSNEPVTSCVPWSATPVQLDDPDVHLADMNGDGLADIVRVRKGDVRYWPGRGNGFFGTGAAGDCTAGTFGVDRHIVMSAPPQFSDLEPDTLHVEDVNGDGLDDVVQVRFDAVDIWLNIDGAGWTADRHIIQKAPFNSSIQKRFRIVDVNGSGTRDLLWGDGNAYKYIDLQGGTRPWVLTHVANGLGKTTELEYASSTELMLAAEKAGPPWQRKAPSPQHVVVRATDRDNLEIAGRPPGVYVTEFSYRDPLYDGRQREFRGFGETTVKRVGDTNSPTSLETTRFLLGECVDEHPDDGVDACATWRDNPREALKGSPALVESRDTKGAYASTTHHTYRLRKLYAGQDGRGVYQAISRQTDSLQYDTAPFSPGSSAVSLPEIETEDLSWSAGATWGIVSTVASVDVPVRGAAGTAHVRGGVGFEPDGSLSVDVFGNVTGTRSEGCVSCTPIDPVLTSHTAFALPPGDGSGWLWRAVHGWADGEPGERRHETLSTYDAKGRPVSTFAILAGTVPLDRSALGVPDAPGASAPGQISLGGVPTYDVFGHALTILGASGRCRAQTYDPTFADLVTSETTYTGAGCTGTELTTHASYDRGLEVTTSVVGPNCDQTLAVFDGFGRVTAVFRPNPLGCGISPVPSFLATYAVTLNAAAAPFSLIHTRTQDGESHLDGEYQDAFSYVDGLGRTILTFAEADPSADGGDQGAFVASGLSEYDAKGATRKAYLPWFTPDGTAFLSDVLPIWSAPETQSSTQRYDAFGRSLETTSLDGMVSLRKRYHALATDVYDAADLTPGPHQGTPATVVTDGHGRTIRTIERVHADAGIEERYLTVTYLSTGEVASITRSRTAGSDQVTRWMRYDSLGRLVLNVDPSSTANFAGPETPTPAVPSSPGDLRAWRYAYNDAGDLVGTSDARGCGVNYHHDGAGRVLAEDFSPCLEHHQTYSEPDLATGYGTEVFYEYDTGGIPNLGRLVRVRDRAASVTSTYDRRGRPTGDTRQIAKPGVPSDDLATRYAPRVYEATTAFDGADRPTAHSTGLASAELLAADGTSTVTTKYSRRGVPTQFLSSYGPLVARVIRDADGAVVETKYGDAASTTTTMGYDDRRRVRTVQTYRGPPPGWSSDPAYSGGPGAPTFQLLLEDSELTYDSVDNPIEIRDWRIASDWPAGAKPVSRTMEYDDLYRVRKVAYHHIGGEDGWASPYAAEDDPALADGRRATPMPYVKFQKRVKEQTFAYDWLGNTAVADDDAKGFYDRSLGAVGNDVYRLKNAAQTGPNGGALDAAYDDTGNMVGLRVQRSGECLPVGATCSQRYAYEWDEVGRLSRARRWDLASPPAADAPPPNATADVELRYAYDGDDDRVLKTAVDPVGNEVHTVYISDSVELRRAPWEVDAGGTFDYRRDDTTEVGYLTVGGERLARLVYEEGAVPSVGGAKLHVFFELGDHLGSTSTVLDMATGELVEKGTYQAYGGVESDYRPSRWKAFREDYRFTGKEEDIEVGLHYFGKRYLSPALGRWISPDPLTVHVLGADLNAYAYVHGQVISSTDPLGLKDEEGRVLRGLDGKLTIPNWHSDFLPTPQNAQQERIREEHLDLARELEDMLNRIHELDQHIRQMEDTLDMLDRATNSPCGYCPGGKDRSNEHRRDLGDSLDKSYRNRNGLVDRRNSLQQREKSIRDRYNQARNSAPEPKTRLPRSRGKWLGKEGNSAWKSDIPEVNQVTKGRPIMFKNGRPDFSPWSQGRLRFKRGELNGSDNDFALVYQRLAKNLKLDGGASAAKKWLSDRKLTPHHHSTTEIHLIPQNLHGKIPHVGSASDLRALFGN